jgi:hypothetical protein
MQVSRFGRANCGWRYRTALPAPIDPPTPPNVPPRTFQSNQVPEGTAAATAAGRMPPHPAARMFSPHGGSDAFPGGRTLWVELLHPGSGDPPTAGDVVEVHYATLLAKTGRLVDTTRSGRQRQQAIGPMTVLVGSRQVVDGMDAGLRQLALGALARIHCPAALAYGGAGNGDSVPPHADLVFEVEMVGVNGRRVKGLRSLELRCLSTIPVTGGPPSALASAAAVQTPAQAAATAAALQVAKVERRRRREEGGCTPASAESEADLSDVDAFDPPSLGPSCATLASDGHVACVDARAAPSSLPAWPAIARLRPPVGKLFPENRHFLDLVERTPPEEWRRALRGNECDGARILLPGSLAIERAPYHSFKWDSRTPVVLTGERREWPCFRWGWRYWGEAHGDDLVSCSQRAPIFDSDVWSDSVTAEMSLQEYVEYARNVHRQPMEAQRETPLLYANGWEVFEAHPELWDFSLDQIPGTIDNRNAEAYREALGPIGLARTKEDLAAHVRHYCKLFVAPRGAVTRMHQDNHHAHAWLSQVRGRKLYVLCAPADYALVAPKGKGADQGGTTKEGVFDPLDVAQRAAREAAGLRVYATVLQPGETIVAPDCWWHYAVSLTPTITLMDNFWDGKNMAGLRAVIRSSFAPAADERPMPHPRRFRPRAGGVLLRQQPEKDAPVVGSLHAGEVASFDMRKGEWVRTSEPTRSGAKGWASEAGLEEVG